MRIISIIISALKGNGKWRACDCFEFENCESRVQRLSEYSLHRNLNHSLHVCNIKQNDIHYGMEQRLFKKRTGLNFIVD